MALIGQAVLEKSLENVGHIHVYSPRAGADNPIGVNYFSLTHLFSQFSPSPLNDCNSFPIQAYRQPNLTLSKIGQGQPRVIIYINFCRA